MTMADSPDVAALLREHKRRMAEIEKARLALKRRLVRLVPLALAGDDKAIDDLKVLLPNNYLTCFPPLPGARRPKRFPYTVACLGRDLAERGHPKARKLLIFAWSHCHRTSIGSLGGISEMVDAFKKVRAADPTGRSASKARARHRAHDWPG